MLLHVPLVHVIKTKWIQICCFQICRFFPFLMGQSVSTNVSSAALVIGTLKIDTLLTGPSDVQ